MHTVLAYIDPGSGSLAIQAVIAALVAAPFVLRNQISRFVNCLRGGEAPAAAAAQGRRTPGVTAGDAHADPSSWRDPSGFVFRRDGTLYRQVNRVAVDEWTALEGSGFLTGLQADGLLIPHETVALDVAADPSRVASVIRPEPIPLVSYPYEWTFGQLKAAALLTLEIQQRAVAAGVHPPRRQRLQRPVPRRAPDPDRHPVVPARRGRGALGRVSTVLRALPGATGPDGAARHPSRRPAPQPPRRDPAGPRRIAAARPDASLAGPGQPRPPARPRPAAARRPARGGRGLRRHGDEPDSTGGASRQPRAGDLEPRLDTRGDRMGRLRRQLLVR